MNVSTTVHKCSTQHRVKVEQGLTSHQTHYTSYRGRIFYGSNDPTNSVKAMKAEKVLRTGLQSHQVHPTMLTIIQQLCSMKQTKNTNT